MSGGVTSSWVLPVESPDFTLDPTNPQPSPWLTEPTEHTLRWPRLGQPTAAVIPLTPAALVIPVNGQAVWSGTIVVNRPAGNTVRPWRWIVTGHSPAWFTSGYVGDFYLIHNGNLNGDVFWSQEKLDSADDTYRNVYGLGHKAVTAAGAAAAATASVTLTFTETIYHRQSGATPAGAPVNLSAVNPARFSVWAGCDD